jgi:16S rRNA (cytosine967-C5)-methyltransferase
MVDLSRQISVDVLSSFDVNYNQLTVVLNKVFSKHGVSISKQQRSRVIVNEVIRRRGILDYIIEKCSSKKIENIQPKLRAIIRVGCYELLFDDVTPSFAAIHSAVELGKRSINKKAGSMVNAVLRNIQREQQKNPGWSE